MFFNDRDGDTLEIRSGLTAGQLRLVSRQSHMGKATAVLIFTPEEAERIRDQLIELYPLPVVEPAMSVVGELASFSPAQGITINIANLTLNARSTPCTSATLVITPTEDTAMTVYYEWDVEEVADADMTSGGQDYAKDDIMEHWHQSSFKDCLAFIANNTPEKNVRYDVCVVRDDDNRRAWAYVDDEDGLLPEFFEDADGVAYKKVTKALHAEVARARKR